MPPLDRVPPPERYRSSPVWAHGFWRSGGLRRLGWAVAFAGLVMVVDGAYRKSSAWRHCLVCARPVETTMHGFAIPFTETEFTVSSTELVRRPTAVAALARPGHTHRGPRGNSNTWSGWIRPSLTGGECILGGIGEAGAFARRLTDDQAFFDFVTAGIASGDISRDDVSAAMEVVNFKYDYEAARGWDPAELRAMDAGNALYARFAGKPIAEVDLWDQHTER